MALSRESRNEVIVSWVLFSLATILVGLRCIANRLLKKTLDLSDIFCLLAWPALLALTIQMVLWSIIGGNGRHPDTLSLYSQHLFFKLFYGNQIVYFILSALIKLSINFFYRSIFFADNGTRIATTIVAVFITLWGVAITIACIFQCTPIRAVWLVGTGRCIKQIVFLEAVQYINIVLDFVLLIMPWPVIWKMRTPTREKVELFLVFSLGILACVSGIFRQISLTEITMDDEEFTIYHATLWTLVEPCIAMICCSLPIVRGAIRTTLNEKNTTIYEEHADMREPPRQLPKTSSEKLLADSEASSRDASPLRPDKVYVSYHYSVTSARRLSEPEDEIPPGLEFQPRRSSVTATATAEI